MIKLIAFFYFERPKAIAGSPEDNAGKYCPF